MTPVWLITVDTASPSNPIPSHSPGSPYPYAVPPCADGYIRLIAMQKVECWRE